MIKNVFFKKVGLGLMPLVVFLLLFYSPLCYSKVYIIKENGMSFEEQWDRICADIKLLPEKERVTIFVKSGYFPISKAVEIKNDRHQIGFIGSKKNPPIISGSIEVKEWKVSSDGLWMGHVPHIVGTDYYPDQLYVNGIRAKRSRTPNRGAFLLEDGVMDGTRYGAVLGNNNIRLIEPLEDDDKPFLTIFRKWSVSKRLLKEVSHVNNTLYFDGVEFPSNNRFVKGNWVVMENAKGCIDEPGEWCVDKKGNIFYYPKAGESINKTKFRIPITEKLLHISSDTGQNARITFKNIIFEHTSYLIPIIGSELDQAASDMSAAIEVDSVRNLNFEGCEIRNIANYGIWIRKQCINSTIKGCYFHDLGAGAIKVGSKILKEPVTNQIKVDNNIICRYGVLMESAVGIILFHAANCKIVHNDIHNGYYTGISIGWVWGYKPSPSKNNEIAYNWVSHIGTGLLNDLGGIYTLGKSEGTQIHHNVISDVISGDYRGWGIYADEGTTGILVDRNVVWNCTSGGFHQHYGTENVVTNNIFAWGKESQFTLSGAQEDLPLTFTKNIIIMDSGLLMSGGGVKSNRFVVGKNCYWKVSEGQPKVVDIEMNKWLQTRDTSSIYMNPGVRNPGNADFRIKGNAICKAIDFDKFDYSKAGVYGGRKWRKLAISLR